MPSGPIPARIMIVGEAPGHEEERVGAPFVGASGNELTKMLTEAGINRSQCFITNVIRIRPPNNDLWAFIAQTKGKVTSSHVPLRDRMVMRCVVDGVKLLKQEILSCNPNVIIAVGNCSMWSLTGKWGITDWRGSILPCDLVPGYKVLCTYHPAAIMRQWSWRTVLVQDLRRAARESAFREIRTPKWNFLLRPTIGQVLETIQRLIDRANSGPTVLSVDIETSLHFITCIGLAWNRTEAICIPFTCSDDDYGYWSLDEETIIVWNLRRLLTHPNIQVLGQNFLYDTQHIYRWWGFIPHFYCDTMFSQHVCFVGMPKSLDFQSSIYSEYYQYWKDRSIYDNVEKRDA